MQLGLGSTIVQVGQTSSVPLTLTSSVNITNLNWTLVAPSNRFGNFNFVFTKDVIATSVVQVLDPARAGFTLSAKPSQTLPGSSQLGTVSFTALPAGNAAGQSGQVVVIRAQPLLQAWLSINGHRMMTVYGNPGSSYEVLFNTNLLTT